MLFVCLSWCKVLCHWIISHFFLLAFWFLYMCLIFVIRWHKFIMFVVVVCFLHVFRLKRWKYQHERSILVALTRVCVCARAFNRIKFHSSSNILHMRHLLQFQSYVYLFILLKCKGFFSANANKVHEKRTIRNSNETSSQNPEIQWTRFLFTESSFQRDNRRNYSKSNKMVIHFLFCYRHKLCVCV